MTKNIAIIDRLDSKLYPGGDTTQINAIYNFLVKKKYKVKIIRNLSYDLKGIDVALLFNLTKPIEAYLHSKILNKAQVPYILFPVYWDLESVVPSKQTRFGRGRILNLLISQRVKSYLRPIYFYKKHRNELISNGIKIRQIRTVKNIIREIINDAKYVCPNSFAEKKHLVEIFGIKEIGNKFKVIRNGVNIEAPLPEKISDKIKDLQGVEYICCVGGIGPRKNQLNLIKAVKDKDVKLVIAGEPSESTRGYYNYLRKIAPENVIFTGNLDKLNVNWLMINSLGHIQPSFIETPGLASLEAAVNGSRICVSRVDPVKEYLNNLVLYCNPYSVNSISENIDKLIHIEESTEKLKRFVIENYSWDKVLIPLEELIDKMNF